MAATTQIARYTGAAGSMAYTALDTSSNKLNFSLDDSNSGTTGVNIPTSTGTNYSWYATIGLGVTVTGGAISNRKFYLSSAPTSGLQVFQESSPSTTYTQATSGNKPTDNATTAGPATPSGYAAAATSAGAASAYDAASAASTVNNTAGSNGATAGNFLPNGKFLKLVFGVDNSYSFSANPTALPNINIQYQEQ